MGGAVKKSTKRYIKQHGGGGPKGGVVKAKGTKGKPAQRSIKPKIGSKKRKRSTSKAKGLASMQTWLLHKRRCMQNPTGLVPLLILLIEYFNEVYLPSYPGRDPK